MMRILLHGLLVLCSVAVVLTISEGGLRLLVEGQVGAGDAKGDDEPDRGEKWIRREQRTGWAPLEGANVERRSPDGAPFRMRVNSTGQRGAELGKATPDERRVLFLGDSFTMSSYLAEESTFVHAVEDHLAGAPEVVPINGGVDGYGTYQQLAYYRYYGRPLKPDLVVLCFFMGNDWRDNMISTRQGRLLNPVLIPNPKQFWRHEDPTFRDAGERLLPDPLSGGAIFRPSSAWASQLMHDSLLARLLASRYARMRAKWTGDLAVLDLDHRYYYYTIGFYQGRDDGYFATARDLTLESIEQLRRLVVADGAELALVVLPSQNQVDRREWLRMLQELGVDEVDLGPIDMEYPNKVLGEFCRQQRIPYIDLYRAFATADNVEDLYLTVIGDGHLSAPGHALVAREVGAFLQDGPLKYRSPVVGLYRTGLRAAELGHQAAAENSLKEACALRPDWSAPADALADLYLQQRRWQEAQVLYRQVLDIAPQRKQTWAKLGALLDTMGGQGAEVAWQRALELHPEWWPYYPGLLAHYEGLRQTDKAAQMREQIALLHEAPLPIKRFWWNEHISQGTLAGAGGRWAESAREFKRAIDFLPGEPVAYYNLGRVYQQTKQEQLAKVAYEKALAVDASFTPARQKLKTLRP